MEKPGQGAVTVSTWKDENTRSPAGSSLDPPVVRSISFADQTTRDMGQVEWKKNEWGSKEMFL